MLTKTTEKSVRRMWRLLEIGRAEIAYLAARGESGSRCAFASDETAFVNLVRQCPADKLCAVGLNPRPLGLLSFAKDADIEVVKNILIDIEEARSGRVWDEAVDATKKARAKAFIDERLLRWFTECGFAPPVVADSGSFWHVLCAVAPIKVADNPTIKDGIAAFQRKLREVFKEELSSAGLKIDSTSDLVRKVKVYGTAKPGGPISHLPEGATRVECPKLRSHLIALSSAPASRGVRVELPTAFAEELIPKVFYDRLEHDSRLSATWKGDRTDMDDCSRSGHDLSLASQCVAFGIRDPKTLGAIIYHTPYNQEKWADRSKVATKKYIEHQVGKALAWAEELDESRAEAETKFLGEHAVVSGPTSDRPDSSSRAALTSPSKTTPSEEVSLKTASAAKSKSGESKPDFVPDVLADVELLRPGQDFRGGLAFVACKQLVTRTRKTKPKKEGGRGKNDSLQRADGQTGFIGPPSARSGPPKPLWYQRRRSALSHPGHTLLSGKQATRWLDFLGPLRRLRHPQLPERRGRERP